MVQAPSSKAVPSSHLIVLGLNYHGTPITIREQFVIPDSCLTHALGALKNLPHVREAAVLSTCNRTEVYAVVSDIHQGLQELGSFFVVSQSIADHAILKPNFTLLRDDVALHLFRVASGLDSLILGEGQIISQVKVAHRRALEALAAGPILDQLFKQALSCGKRVRSETSLSKRAVSVSSAALELARDVLGSLAELRILVVGAGTMAKLCTKYLLSESGAGSIVMLNRTPQTIAKFAATKLPNRHKLETAFEFADRHELAGTADLIIVSTSAPEYLLKLEEFKTARRNAQICIIDIAVPRNVDPKIGELPGIKLFHIDHLSSIVNKNLAERESLVVEAEKIVFEALAEFHAREHSRLVAPTIKCFRKKIEDIRLEQIRRAEHKHLEQVSQSMINKILHQPTVKLKTVHSREIREQQTEALKTLFNLDTLSLS